MPDPARHHGFSGLQLPAPLPSSSQQEAKSITSISSMILKTIGINSAVIV
jgi:hypothetical protein